MEGEQKLCLAEPTLELLENLLLQVQTQLLEEMQDLEALAAEVEVEALVERGGGIQVVLLNQEQMEATVEREVMEAVAEEGATEGELLVALQEQEVQEILVALGAEAEAAEMLGLVQEAVEEEIMVVMVQQEAMAEEEEGAVVRILNPIREVLVAAVLVELD